MGVEAKSGVGGPVWGWGQTGVSWALPGRGRWPLWTEGSLQLRLPAPPADQALASRWAGRAQKPGPQRVPGEGQEEGKARP